jgi:hypothetical protein
MRDGEKHAQEERDMNHLVTRFLKLLTPRADQVVAMDRILDRKPVVPGSAGKTELRRKQILKYHSLTPFETLFSEAKNQAGRLSPRLPIV